MRRLNERRPASTWASHGRRPSAKVELRGHDRPGQGRVRVAVDEHAVGPSLDEHRLEAAQHLAGHRAVRPAADLQVHGPARRHLEVAEEGRAHRVVVVLAGVDQDLVGAAAAQRAADRRRLHELRPRADDGDDLHAILDRRERRAAARGSRRRTAPRRRRAAAAPHGARAPEPSRRVAGDQLVVGHVAR